MHVQLTLIAVEAKTVGTVRRQFDATPFFSIGLQLLQDTFCQIRTMDQQWGFWTLDSMMLIGLDGGRW